MCGVALLNGVWRKDFQWTGLVPSLIFVSSFVCEAAGSVIGKPIVAPRQRDEDADPVAAGGHGGQSAD